MGCETKAWWVMPLLFVAANYMQHRVYGESPQVPCLFIFGDSLSDSGNNNKLPTSAKSNYSPYGIDFPTGPTGRFTNGRTSIDIITQFLGFEKFIPPFANTSGSDTLKGVNYASGGAGIRVETGMHNGAIISLGLQLKNHRVIVSQIAKRLGSADKAQQYLNKCLYYVNIGSNDYIGNYYLPQFYSTSSIYSPQQYGDALIEELSLNLMALHDFGARKYVLVGLGLLGCTVNAIRGTNGSCAEEENAGAFIFNNKLKSLVDSFNNKFSANSKFIFINSSSEVLDNARAPTTPFLLALNPDLFDWRITIHGACVSDFFITNASCCQSDFGVCVPDQRPCYNRNDYLFWDQVHPTEAWNLLIATMSYNSTSDPDFTYPMDIKHLVDQEIEMELEFKNESTSQLSATQ